MGNELPTDVPLAYWLAFGGLSLLILATLASYYKGLQLGPVALVSPMVSVHVVVVVLLVAVFMHERLGLVQMVGISAAVAGVMLVSVTSGRTHAGVGKGVWFGLATMVGAGLFVFAFGGLSREFGWFLPLYMVRLGSLIFLLPLQMSTHSWPWQRLSAKLVLVAALVGALNLGGLALFASGAEVGQLSIVAATFAIYPIIPVVGGLVIFHEKLANRQATGLAFALGGLVVLGIAS